MCAVFLKCAGQRKLAQTMADHVFRDEHRVKNFAVMHVERQPDEIGGDHRTAGPGLDRGLGLYSLGLVDLVLQMLVNEWTFFNGTTHKITFSSLGDHHGAPK